MLYRLMMFFDEIARKDDTESMEFKVKYHLTAHKRGDLLVLRDGCQRMIEIINQVLQS